VPSHSHNDFFVISSISSTELPDDPATLAEQAKAGAPRKVIRLLERAFNAPFVAATELVSRYTTAAGHTDTVDLERFALFTVSNWDPAIPIPDYASEDQPDLIERLSHYYTHPANPTDWLRRMPNNPLCNVAISTGLRGPTMHFTGRADSLSLLTTVAIANLANGCASAAIVLAFDLPDGAENLLAEQSDSRAAGVLLGSGNGDIAAEELADFAAGVTRGVPAVAAMDMFIEHASARTRLRAGKSS